MTAATLSLLLLVPLVLADPTCESVVTKVFQLKKVQKRAPKKQINGRVGNSLLLVNEFALIC